MHSKLELKNTPKRIISLVLSQTELLYDLGLKEEVIGITKFCVHPNEWFKTKTKIGGTKKFDFDKINALKPDLIIGNKEENEQLQIEALQKLYPVWMSDITTLKNALDMITRIGMLVGKQESSIHLKLRIESAFKNFIMAKHQINKIRIAYFIWKKPYMVAGLNTFINALLNSCGFINVFENQVRYPEITLQELKVANPQVILLSSEPYPFKEKHINEFHTICPNAKILLVDGELFSWYGSRLLKAPTYFTQLIQQLV